MLHSESSPIHRSRCLYQKKTMLAKRSEIEAEIRKPLGQPSNSGLLVTVHVTMTITVESCLENLSNFDFVNTKSVQQWWKQAVRFWKTETAYDQLSNLISADRDRISDTDTDRPQGQGRGSL